MRQLVEGNMDDRAASDRACAAVTCGPARPNAERPVEVQYVQAQDDVGPRQQLGLIASEVVRVRCRKARPPAEADDGHRKKLGQLNQPRYGEWVSAKAVRQAHRQI